MQSNAHNIEHSDYDDLAEHFQNFVMALDDINYCNSYQQAFEELEFIKHTSNVIDTHNNKQLVESFKRKFGIEVPATQAYINIRNQLVWDLKDDIIDLDKDEEDTSSLIELLNSVCDWNPVDMWDYPVNA